MRIALAYAGSLEDAAAVAWLRGQHGAEVVTVSLDLGQGRELEAVRDQALALGAHRAHVLDARESFAQRFVLPALLADAQCRGRAPMGRGLSRAAIAERLAEIAAIERADAVAHAGAAGSVLGRLLRCVVPPPAVISAADAWALTADDLAAFARRHGWASTAPQVHGHVESTLWGRSMRLTPGAGTAPAFFWATRPAAVCPDEPATVDIRFERGVPTGLNGVGLPLLELITSVGTLAATHGVGRVELDDILIDAPAAVLLGTAHRELTRAATTPDAGPLTESVTAAYASVVDDGGWFSPVREALDAFFRVTQQRVTGHVRLRLLRGGHTTIGTELAEASDSSPAGAALFSAQH